MAKHRAKIEGAKSQPAKVVVAFTLRPDLLEQLDHLAKALRKSRSQLAADLIEQSLGHAELSAKMLNGPFLEAMYRAMSSPAVAKQFADALGEKLNDEQLQLWQAELTKFADVGGAMAAAGEKGPEARPASAKRAKRVRP